MKKLLIALAAMIGFLFVGAGAGQAESSIRLFLDKKELKAEVPPRIMNNSTMVPVRIISEELGAKVSWHAPEKKVTVEKKGLTIQLYIDKTDAYVNGAKSKLETAPVLSDGNTLLPVRFVSEALGLTVSWDDLNRSVSLFNKEETGGSVSQPTSVPGGTAPAAKPVAATTAPAKEPAGTKGPAPSPTPSPSAAASVKPTGSSAPGATPKPNSSTPPAPGSTVPPGTGDDAGTELPEVQQIMFDGSVLRIKTNGTAPKPKLSMLKNPQRLIIDLPNAALGKTVNGVSAVQNGEVAVTHPSVAKIRYALFLDNPSTVRIVVDLTQKISYNLLESDKPGELAFSLRTTKYRVVLDAGHGGTDSGAISVTGRYEKDFNLAVIKRIAKILEADSQLDVQLTRTDDSTVELNDRAPFANDREADVFVSVHANNFKTNPSIRGVETYYTREDSAALAAILHKKILGATGSADRKVRTADFRVTKYTEMPAVLCEIGYLSNAEEEKQLFDESVQARVAASIAAGIKEYLQIP